MWLMCIKLSKPAAKKVRHMQLAISTADGFRTSIDLTQAANLEWGQTVNQKDTCFSHVKR